MSSLLSKSFDALEPTIIKRRPCILVRPKKQPQRQFYGYPVSREWLVHFAERQCPETLRDRREKGYKCDAAMRAYEHIAICTSINTNTVTLDLKLCFHPQRGSALREYIYAYTIPGGYDVELSDEEIISLFDIDEVYLFFVCTDEEDSLEKRPTQTDMDYLTKLMGHGPQWWMNCNSLCEAQIATGCQKELRRSVF